MLWAQRGLVALFVTILLVAYQTAQAEPNWRQGKSKVCVSMATNCNEDFLELLDRLEAQYGLQVVLAFPPNAAVGYMPTMLRGKINDDGNFIFMDDHNFSKNALSTWFDATDLNKLVSAWIAFSNPDSIRKPEADESACRETPQPLCLPTILSQPESVI